MVNLNITLSLTILALFIIVITIGYVYVNESRKSSEEAKDAIQAVNKTDHEFLQEWRHKQEIDNVRFNKTLDGLAATYDLIVGNQKRIINLTNLQIELTDFQNNHTQQNLNLTKFNRAALVDTNHIIRELAEANNIALHPFNSSKLD